LPVTALGGARSVSDRPAISQPSAATCSQFAATTAYANAAARLIVRMG